MNSLKINVDESASLKRLDQAIATSGSLSRVKARKIIALGGCYLNRKRIHKNGARLHIGDSIELFWRDQELEDLSQKASALSHESILYRDDEIIGIQKPQGLPSQATRTQSKVHLIASLENLDLGPLFLVHRLDRDTSGVMLLARTKKAYKRLSELFTQRLVKKDYRCWVHGHPTQPSWSCDLPIGKIKASEGRVYIDKKGGRQALTHFTELHGRGDSTLILAQPVTGRTHQIRVHLESCGLPIVGDKHYGGCAAEHGLMLHAQAIEFPYWKTGKSLRIESRFTPEFSP